MAVFLQQAGKQSHPQLKIGAIFLEIFLTTTDNSYIILTDARQCRASVSLSGKSTRRHPAFGSDENGNEPATTDSNAGCGAGSGSVADDHLLRAERTGRRHSARYAPTCAGDR